MNDLAAISRIFVVEVYVLVSVSTYQVTSNTPNGTLVVGLDPLAVSLASVERICVPIVALLPSFVGESLSFGDCSVTRVPVTLEAIATEVDLGLQTNVVAIIVAVILEQEDAVLDGGVLVFKRVVVGI